MDGSKAIRISLILSSLITEFMVREKGGKAKEVGVKPGGR
jgi:hypothetical protein